MEDACEREGRKGRVGPLMGGYDAMRWGWIGCDLPNGAMLGERRDGATKMHRYFSSMLNCSSFFWAQGIAARIDEITCSCSPVCLFDCPSIRFAIDRLF